MKKLLLIVNCCALIAMMGCSTMKGIGQDIGTLGDWMTKGSDNVRNAD